MLALGLASLGKGYVRSCRPSGARGVSMVCGKLATAVLAALSLSALSACNGGVNPYDPAQRALAGALIGAGSGAAIGAIAGGGEGAAIGAAAGGVLGAVAGAATTPSGPPPQAANSPYPPPQAGPYPPPN